MDLVLTTIKRINPNQNRIRLLSKKINKSDNYLFIVHIYGRFEDIYIC